MNKLYMANCQTLGSYNSVDSNIWNEIHKIIGMNVSLIDRTDTIKMPFDFEIYSDFIMPKLSQQFNLTYEDCCNNRSIDLLNMARSINKPITVLYSGGIDSTLILVSLMKNCSVNELKDLITVALSSDSIVENPNFYYDYVRKNFKITSSDNIGRYFDESRIVVGGEFNDQLFGSETIGHIYREFDYYKINDRYSREFITQWFILKGMSTMAANRWFDLIDWQIKTVSECLIVTNFHFFWWLNFCFKWQSVFFRILARVDVNMRSYITHDFVKQYFHHYYSTVDFQLWSMLNHDKKLIDNWNSYKIEAKRIIYEFNHDTDYRDNKIKITSLSKLFQQRNTSDAIDSDFNFIDEFKLIPEMYYNSNNSFV